MSAKPDSWKRSVGAEPEGCSEPDRQRALPEGGLVLSGEDVERLAQSLGQAYVTMESAGRYVAEQDRSPAAVALVAAMESARRALTAMLVRLLAAWTAAVALGLADIMDYPM
ncbi:MAG: hypothetical protein JST22_13765 [Bacteroidetes bacterium]|nr:hypothetical protein [Bacteroidota bacterium]